MRVLIYDRENTYIFESTRGSVKINGVPKGLGKILTPIPEIALKTKVKFTLNGKNYSTRPIKACAYDERD